MAKHKRKCDTDKYRRRHAEEKAGKKARLEQWRREEAVREIEREKSRKWFRAVKEEEHRVEKSLVQVIANHLYLVSPEHAEKARAKAAMNELRQVFNLFRGQMGIYDIGRVLPNPIPLDDAEHTSDFTRQGG